MKITTGISSMTIKRTFLATAVVGALVGGFSASASAVPVYDDWQFRLSLANGGAVSGAADATHVDHLEVSGNSIVTQQLVNGLPAGGTFTDSGYLQIPGYKVEPGNGAFVPITAGTTSGTPNILYIRFDGLTGHFNADNTITFDPNVGTIGMYLDNDTDFNPATGTSTQLAAFNLIAPSGGNNVNFFGGASGTTTIDVTLQETSGIPGLFSDSSGNPLALDLTLSLVNVNALLDPNFNGGQPLYSPTGCNPPPLPGTPNPPTPNCTSALLHVQNAGQFNISAVAVPEPGTLALVGTGLLFLGFAGRRRKAR